MPCLNALLMVAGIAVGQAPAPTKLAEAAVKDVSSATATPATAVPHVAFEIHDVTTTSPDWRGRTLPKLQPVARQESVAAWALDQEGVVALLAACQADPKAKVLQAPRMVARLGDPVRMTNEDTSKYVAHMRRISDSPPNRGTSVAFEPIVDEVHDGIRVELTQTRLKGPVLLAHVVIQHNKLLGFTTTNYTESVVNAESDPGVVKTSLLSKLRPEGSDKLSINATLQVPEVSSRRIEGDWMIPSDGAMLISMGPHSLGANAGRHHYEERLILVTARIEQVPAVVEKPKAAPATPPAKP
ncbi:hypothetical protein [Paludisphaera mucosa]|uniref:Uncharacterized protein n=1 Tax=Paludisphaera mucosa TaxID=3030827 RepID=A0ABT6F584_9BACT|nr:hypothetical protein [Paludisphaera mucosa]MDG3002742.1 hypothetical protein [Paludisphaera mucosa]